MIPVSTVSEVSSNFLMRPDQTVYMHKLIWNYMTANAWRLVFLLQQGLYEYYYTLLTLLHIVRVDTWKSKLCIVVIRKTKAWLLIRCSEREIEWKIFNYFSIKNWNPSVLIKIASIRNSNEYLQHIAQRKYQKENDPCYFPISKVIKKVLQKIDSWMSPTKTAWELSLLTMDWHRSNSGQQSHPDYRNIRSPAK